MNLLRKLQVWWHGLFYGMASADDIITHSNLSDDKSNIIINQVKENKRVAPALLKGEITQEVVDLRYRDYRVSENSRNFKVFGDEARPMRVVGAIRKDNNYKFSGLNHVMTAGIVNTDAESHTLKIEYDNNVLFQLEKYCDHFSVDGNKIALYFSAIPNKNIITSKAFCNHLNKCFTQIRKGCEYSKIKSLEFITQKITAVPNYLKFVFQNLMLLNIEFDKLEIKMEFLANKLAVENLLDKYTSVELEEKYRIKAPKFLPQETTYEQVNNICSICGKNINANEGKMNQQICGDFCCTECLCEKLLTERNNLVK